MDSATAVLHLIFLSAMILILVGGLVLILVLWYVRGRDPHAGLVAAYLDHPPDDLPPGAAGTLLDEHADEHDVMATLLGLARHHAVEITEVQEGRGRDFTLTLAHPDRIQDRIERDLLTVLFGPNPTAGQQVRLSQVRGAFLARREQIRHDLYRAMVDRGYFTRSPDDTRRRWRILSWAGIVASIVAGVVLTVLTDAWAMLPAIAAVVVWMVMLRVARRMPQKTRHGSEAAAKWRAFRTYLADIRKYESLETATDLFDRYLAYAVAFGLEKRWVRDFETAGAPVPRWYHGAGDILVLGDVGEAMWHAGQLGRMAGHIGSGGGVGDLNLPDFGGVPDVGMPDLGGGLQGASELMSSGLQGASDGLFDLFDSAGSIFDAFDFDF
jgi:hypothetical protein